MITDSIDEIETHLERILREASKASDDKGKYAAFEKYLRLWNLISLLNKEHKVNKRRLMVSVFKEHVDELESLLASNLITVTNETFLSSASKKSDSVSSLLHQSLDSVAIKPGSPKLNTAMGLLLKDPLMLQQVEWVQQQIESKKLKDKKKDLLEKRKRLLDERNTVVGHLEKLVSGKKDWDSIGGEAEWDHRYRSYLLTDETLFKSIEEVEQDIQQVKSEIQDMKQAVVNK